MQVLAPVGKKQRGAKKAGRVGLFNNARFSVPVLANLPKEIAEGVSPLYAIIPIAFKVDQDIAKLLKHPIASKSQEDESKWITAPKTKSRQPREGRNLLAQNFIEPPRHQQVEVMDVSGVPVSVTPTEEVRALIRSHKPVTADFAPKKFIAQQSPPPPTRKKSTPAKHQPPPPKKSKGAPVM